MKAPFITAIVGGLFIAAEIGRAQQFFSENFNYGVFNPNLTTNADYGFTMTLTTNTDGNGVIKVSQPNPLVGTEGTITTAFSVIGDFTASIRVMGRFPLPHLPAGLKMLTDQGEASVFVDDSNPNWSGGVHSEISFPSFTNLVHGAISGDNGCYCCFASLRIRRIGSALLFESSLYYNCGPAPFSERIQAATNTAFAAPAKLQIFLQASTFIYPCEAAFDDFLITADQFNPTPTPSLTTLIAPVAFQISWPSQINRHYQIWSATALAPNTWTPLGSPLDGTGFWMSMTNWVSGPRRFYQAVETP